MLLQAINTRDFVVVQAVVVVFAVVAVVANLSSTSCTYSWTRGFAMAAS